MTKEDLLSELKQHQRKVEKLPSNTIYTMRLDRAIRRLEGSGYKDDDELINDLEILGFQDKARDIRRGKFI